MELRQPPVPSPGSPPVPSDMVHDRKSFTVVEWGGVLREGFSGGEK